MALHPDDRPESMAMLSRFLFEGGNIPARGRPPQVTLGGAILDVFGSRPDAALAWGALSLLLLSLIATLVR